jgi:hypothetical protein
VVGRYRIDYEKNTVYLKLTGNVDIVAFKELFNKAVESDEYEAGMARLWDLSEADLSEMSAEDIDQMTKYSSIHYPDFVNAVKVAFVATNPRAFGLTRMFALISEAQDQANVQVFDNLADAEKWIAQ